MSIALGDPCSKEPKAHMPSGPNCPTRKFKLGFISRPASWLFIYSRRQARLFAVDALLPGRPQGSMKCTLRCRLALVVIQESPAD